MKKAYFICLIILFSSMYLMSCEDILEKDISEIDVLVVAPLDSVTLDDNDVTFLWEPVNGASYYLLQVASPNFDAAQKIAEDTVLNINSHYASLDSGNYEWRVKGYNSAYETKYYYNSFFISRKITGN